MLYHLGNIYLIVKHVKEVGSICKMYRDINVVHPLMQWKLLVQHGKKQQQFQGMCNIQYSRLESQPSLHGRTMIFFIVSIQNVAESEME